MQRKTASRNEDTLVLNTSEQPRMDRIDSRDRHLYLTHFN